MGGSSMLSQCACLYFICAVPFLLPAMISCWLEPTCKSHLIKIPARAPEPLFGPCPVQRFDFTDGPGIKSVWLPANATGQNFKAISYAHGMWGGDENLVYGYDRLLSALSSFGFVVIATSVCNTGCNSGTLDPASVKNLMRQTNPRATPEELQAEVEGFLAGAEKDGRVAGCVSLEGDPPCFGNYYEEMLAALTWAKGKGSREQPFASIDWKGGVGLAGHSMGGQATLRAASGPEASEFDVKAAVLHFPYTNSFPIPVVPYLVFTGSDDDSAPPAAMARPVYEAGRRTGLPRGYACLAGEGHHTPDAQADDPKTTLLLAQFTAAWFKVHLDGSKQRQELGGDYSAMLDVRL